MRTRAVIALLVAGVLGAAGCSSEEPADNVTRSETATNAAPQDATSVPGEQTPAADGADGDGGQAEPAPSAFPADYPVPDGAETVEQQPTRLRVSIDRMSLAEAIAFYEERLPADGWEIVSSEGQDGLHRFRVRGHDREGEIVLRGGEDSTFMVADFPS